MSSFIIKYSPSTMYYYYGTTLDVHFIAIRAAPANSSSSNHSQHLAYVALNLLQAIIVFNQRLYDKVFTCHSIDNIWEC